MTEKDFDGGENPDDKWVPPEVEPRKKRRLLLKIFLILLVVIILLVLAAPTLLSTGPVVSIVLGQVNKQLNGKVEIQSLSLGWFTGIKVDGVRVADASGTQIAEIDHAAVGYPLWKAITGKFALGDVPLDGVSFDAKIDSNGQLNFAQLAKPSPTTSAPESEPATESKPSKLPDISANFKLTNCHGTFSQAAKPTVYLTKLDGEIDVPEINQPITNQINAAVKLGDQPEGTIVLSGTAAVINGNQIALDSAEIHEKLELQNIDLQTAKPCIPDSVGVSTLDGALGVHLAIDLTGGKNAALDAAITATQPIAFGGKVLQGDTFTTKSFEADVPKLSAVFPDGLDKWQSGRITVGSAAGSSPILLKLDQGQVTVVADLMPQAILNAIAKKKPGSNGQLVVTSSFDLAAIIPQLRHSIPEVEGVIIKSAGLTEKLKLVFSPDKSDFSNSADSTPVTGTQTINGQPRDISIPDMHVTVSASDLGGGTALPNLHGLLLKIQTPFANGEFQGESLSDLHGTLKANLQSLQNEVSQFIDMGKINLGGDLSVDITGQGKLTEAPYRASVTATIGLRNFKYGDATGQRVNEPLVKLIAAADLQGSAANTVESAKNVSVSLKVGDASASTVDVLAQIPSINLIGGNSGEFNLSHLTIDLAKLQQQLAAVPAGQAGVVVNQGVLSISSAGKFSAHSLALDSLAINADQLFVNRVLANGQQINAIAGDGMHLNLAGGVDLTPTADGKSFDAAVRLKTFTLSDIGQILDIHKDGPDDLVLTQPVAGTPAGHGQLAMAIQLGSINKIAGILAQTELVAKTTAGNLQTGKLSGTVAMTSAGPSKTGVDANLAVDNVVVTTSTGTLPATATLVLKATADQAASTVAIDQATIQSNLASASVTGASISLSAKSVLDQLQSAHWQIDVPNLKPVMDLVNAFSPAADKSAPPMEFTTGSISLNGDLSHDNSTVKINVSEVSAKNVSFTKGPAHYFAKPVEVNLLVAIQNGQGKTVMDQIRQVQITRLTGDLGVATLSMPTPISISQLSTTPIATGGIQLVGNLTDLTRLLSALQGQTPDAYPYRGDYTLTENIGTQQNTISLKGGIQVAGFQCYNGDAVTFSENLVNVGNDLSFTTIGNDESVAITSFTAAMQSSGAANISLKNGSINHLQSSRDMQLQLNVGYDLAKIWPIVQPMIGDQYKTVKIAGQFQKQFNVTGSYPANVPSTVAMKTLHVDGDIAVQSFDYDGLNLQNFVLPFTLDNGQLVTVYANKGTAAPAVCNSGTLDLNNLTIDLTQDPPRLTTPPHKALISQVTINPIFAGSILKNVINNPLFAGSKGATGLIDVTIDDCTNLPLGDLVMQQVAANSGKTDLRISITKLNIGLGADALQSVLKAQSFEADVKDGTVSIAKGIATEHINFSTGQYVLSFDGSVRLRDEAYVPMILGFPAASIAKVTHLPYADYYPDQLKVPMEGTVSKTKYRFDKVLPKAATDAAAKALAGGLLGGNKGGGIGGGNSDPLGGLLNRH